LPAGSDDEWIQRILSDNHEIELAEGQQEQAHIVAQRAGREMMPDPTVGVRYSNNLGGIRRVVGVTFSVPLGGPSRSAAHAAALGEASVASQTPVVTGCIRPREIIQTYVSLELV